MSCRITQNLSETQTGQKNKKQRMGELVAEPRNPLMSVMSGELGVWVNKMLLLSQRLLAASEHRDLPPPLIPLLSPATNQVGQTTFRLSREKWPSAAREERSGR